MRWMRGYVSGSRRGRWPLFSGLAMCRFVYLCQDLVDNDRFAKEKTVENGVLWILNLVELDFSIIFVQNESPMEGGVVYFRRKMYDTMLKWKSERNGDTALLIQGARRVGKSTVAEEFARHEYKSYILIDFSKVSKEVSDLFNDISDLNYLFIRLQFIYQVQLYERESVIILDEVQL